MEPYASPISLPYTYNNQPYQPPPITLLSYHVLQLLSRITKKDIIWFNQFVVLGHYRSNYNLSFVLIQKQRVVLLYCLLDQRSLLVYGRIRTHIIVQYVVGSM